MNPRPLLLRTLADPSVDIGTTGRSARRVPTNTTPLTTTTPLT